MRLWSIHPLYLDPQGLVALLHEETRGYRHHPQRARFKQHPAPLAAIARYLQAVQAEASQRGYAFDARKTFAAMMPPSKRLAVSAAGLLPYE